jgi:methyl-accepting chemotaxis protein
MTRLRPTGLRVRLLLTAIVGAVVVVAALVGGFNLVLDARLRGDADNLLRQRVAVQLQTLSTLDGRLRVSETPDSAVTDTQTWVFAGGRALERPVAGPRDQRAALALVDRAPRLQSVDATDTRLEAVPIVAGRRVGTLVAGISLTPYENSAHTALIASLVLGALTVLAIALASWWVIGRALAPVARMTAKAADWGEHDLSRRFYAGESHDELSTLAATFDQLLERLFTEPQARAAVHGRDLARAEDTAGEDHRAGGSRRLAQAQHG